MSTHARSVSIKYFEPVTVPASTQNESVLTILVGYDWSLKRMCPSFGRDIENCKMKIAKWLPLHDDAFPATCILQFSICILLDFKAVHEVAKSKRFTWLNLVANARQQGCLPAQDLHNRRESGQRSYPSLKVPGSSRRDSEAHGWSVSHGKCWDRL